MLLAKLLNVLLLSVMAINVAVAQTPCSHSPSDNGPAPAFVISGGAIRMPVGFFLLVRRGDAIGAIRLTSAAPSGQDNWFGTSSYESFFQPDPASSLTLPSAVRHASSMDFRQTKGIHAVYLYGSGHHEAFIGRWRFHFANPTLLPMTDSKFWKGEMDDHGLEFAPTSACDLTQINVHDPRLRWYPFDRNAHISFPVADLPRTDPPDSAGKN